MKKEEKEGKKKSKPLPRSGKILPGHFDFLPKSKKDSRGTEGREVEIIETIISFVLQKSSSLLSCGEQVKQGI